MTPTATILLANGFEEIEAIAVIDILRRAGVQLTIAGLTGTQITGGQKLTVLTDCIVSDLTNKPLSDVLILPGGNGGVDNLQASSEVETLIRHYHQQGRKIAAICAAPRILDAMGLLTGKKATSYPGTRPDMKHCEYKEDTIVRDGQFLTSRGPGTAMAFGYAILEDLGLSDHATALRQGMVFLAKD